MGSRRRSRAVAQKRRERNKRRQKYFVGGLIVVVLVLIGVGVYYAIGSQNQPGEEFEDQGNAHLEEEPSEYIWNSRPPTSGPHAPSIAPWGAYTETVPEWRQVHNLEDGGVIVHYNCPDGCPETVDELESIMRDVDEGLEQMILHPYENMDSRIALTAWTHRLALDEVDEDQIRDFIDAYRGDDHHR